MLQDDLDPDIRVGGSQSGTFLWGPGARETFVRRYLLDPGLHAAAAIIPDDPGNLELFEIASNPDDGFTQRRRTVNDELFFDELTNGSDEVQEVAVRARRDPDGPGGPEGSFSTPELHLLLDDDVVARGFESRAPRIGPNETVESAIDAWSDEDLFKVDVADGLFVVVSLEYDPANFARSLRLGFFEGRDAVVVAGERIGVTPGGGPGWDGYIAVSASAPDFGVVPEPLTYALSVEVSDTSPDILRTGAFGRPVGDLLSPGETASTVIDGALDFDTVSFDATEGAAYGIGASDASGDRLVMAEIFDGAGGLLASGVSAGGAPLEIVAATSGIHHVRVTLLGEIETPSQVRVELTGDEAPAPRAEPSPDAAPDAAASAILGDGGPNRLDGAAGPDEIRGLGGADRLRGRGGDDELYGGAGRDRLFGQGGDDLLFGQGGADRLAGGGGGDGLSGGGGRDRLKGGGGADRLDGGGGIDALTGGAGRDVFVQSGGRDRVTDWRDGQDVFEIAAGAARFRQLDITQRGDDVVIGTRAGDFRVEDARVRQFDAGDFEFV